MSAKNGIDWSSLWKKDDWLGVWIGFLIIVLVLVGLKITLPKFKWTTDAAFAGFARETSLIADKLAMEECPDLSVSRCKQRSFTSPSGLHASDKPALLRQAAGWLDRPARVICCWTGKPTGTSVKGHKAL